MHTCQVSISAVISYDVMYKSKRQCNDVGPTAGMSDVAANNLQNFKKSVFDATGFKKAFSQIISLNTTCKKHFLHVQTDFEQRIECALYA